MALVIAAKQDAFEESIRLKNQFRNLDEDEIEFLDSVLESTREKEAAVKRETAEQLGIFRQQQEEADRSLTKETIEMDSSNVAGKPGSPSTEVPTWAVNLRKRKRVKEKDAMTGVKLRKTPSTVKDQPFTGDVSTKPQSPITPAANTKSLSDVHSDLMPFLPNMQNPSRPNTVPAATATYNNPASIVHASEIIKQRDSGRPGLGLIDYGSEDGSE